MKAIRYSSVNTDLAGSLIEVGCSLELFGSRFAKPKCLFLTEILTASVNREVTFISNELVGEVFDGVVSFILEVDLARQSEKPSNLSHGFPYEVEHVNELVLEDELWLFPEP